MNKDVHMIFEAYKKQMFQILNEAPPVGFDEPFAQQSPEEKQQQIKDVAKEVQFPAGAKGKYELDAAQTEQVIAGVEAKLKEMGGVSKAPYKFFQEQVVAEVVRQVAPAIKTANSKYAARVVYNAMRKGKILKDETTGFGGGVAKDKGYSSAAGKRKLAEIIVADPEKFEGEEVNELESAAPEASQDAATTRIANWAFEEIDPVAGAPEQDVITSIQRKILSSGGLGMEEKSIVSKIKAVLNILVSSKVIERKAGKLIFGSNFDKFETASEDTSNIGKDPLTIAQELGLKGSSENQKYQRGADYWSVQPN